jgi:hypothetical protein
MFQQQQRTRHKAKDGGRGADGYDVRAGKDENKELKIRCRQHDAVLWQPSCRPAVLFNIAMVFRQYTRELYHGNTFFQKTKK